MSAQIESWSIALIFFTFLVIVVVLLAIVLTKNRENLKKYFFALLVATILLTTFFLAFSTVYLNSVSATSGPVHWHMDFEIWLCGQKVNLVDPKGFSNKIGTPLVHEHNDSRLHVEGVVLNKNEVSFGSFISVIGGRLDQGYFSVPTNNGKLIVVDGESCPDGKKGQLQGFVYKVVGKNITQTKLSDIGNYILSPESNVPPGDCLIIEFAETKLKSDHLCESYKVAILKGKFIRGY
ncbi:MAG TPA: hypothetical protein VLE47_00405 [Candidatus Saccharimonadales bacterium]|nr:hypothetical protein [Candidatus Saccharimonadales bacterium]